MIGHRPSRSGFTLIELLIVVAMIAIFSAMSLATVMGPAEEHAYAETELSMDAGLAAAAGQLVTDARAATGIDSTGESRWAFRDAWDGKTVEWFADEAGRLRRAAEGAAGAAPGTSLVEGVTKFAVEKNSEGRWQAIMTVEGSRMARKYETTLTVPLAPAGGAS